MLTTLRTLGRSPGFAASTILTLALGVGANTGAFSALYTLLLKPLPYPEPLRLVTLYETTSGHQPREVAEANLMDWQRRSALFAAMGAFRPRSFGLTLSDQDAVTVIQTGMVTAGFFPSVGVAPLLGRAFTDGEEAADAHLLVLTHRLWRTQFAADPAAVGRKVFLNEDPFTVIGVMPPRFEYPMDLVLPDAFMPLSRRDYCCARLGSLAALGRLKPGVTLTAARSELEAVAAQLAVEYPATNRGRGAGLRPLDETQTSARREPLLLLLAAASLLLLIACANVAGLMVARAFTRRRDVAIRASLGAGPWQIARPFFAESLVLALAGGACGLLAAEAVLRMIPRFIAGAGSAAPLTLDSPAFAFALSLAASLTLLLGSAPALALRHTWASPFPRPLTPIPNPRFRCAALVVAQVAFSVVLLLSAGLLLRSFFHLLGSSPGFETAHALRFGIGLPEKRYDTDLKLVEFHHHLLDRLNAIPGVAAAGAAARFPLRGGAPGSAGTFQIAGSNLPLTQRPHTSINIASPGYFGAMGIPLLAGREFSWRDDRLGVHGVAIVNQAFVRVYLNGRPTLGAVLDLRASTWEIVGVAGDTRQASLDREAHPEVFLSMTQVGCDGAGYVIRARRGEAGLARVIAASVAEQDPRIQRVSVVPVRLLVEQNLGSRTAAIELVGGFAALALLLTAVGIYGVVAFRAAGRSREMAIRLALGATAAQVQGLVLGHAVRLAGAGVALGLAAFLFAAPLLKSQLYGVAAFDPISIAAVACCVAVVALAASAVPGRRAAHNSPLALLRDS